MYFLIHLYGIFHVQVSRWFLYQIHFLGIIYFVEGGGDCLISKGFIIKWCHILAQRFARFCGTVSRWHLCKLSKENTFFFRGGGKVFILFLYYYYLTFESYEISLERNNNQDSIVSNMSRFFSPKCRITDIPA